MSREIYVKKAIAVMMAAYPGASAKQGMAEFLKMAEQVLMRYTPDVLERFASPTNGIASKCKFFPSLAEIKEFCEDTANAIWQAERQSRRSETLQLYGRVERESDLTPAEMAEKREQVAAMFRDLVKEFKGIPDPFRTHGEIPLSKAEQKLQAERWLERQKERAAVEPPPPLSQYAIKTL